MTLAPDPQWYKKIWTLDVQDMSWTERTEGQIAYFLFFLVAVAVYLVSGKVRGDQQLHHQRATNHNQRATEQHHPDP